MAFKIGDILEIPVEVHPFVVYRTGGIPPADEIAHGFQAGTGKGFVTAGLSLKF